MKRLVYLILVIGFISLPVIAEAKIGPRGPDNVYSLRLENPVICRIILYKIYIVRDDGTEVTLYENSSGTVLDLATNAAYVPLATATGIQEGRYLSLKFIVSTTWAIKGYALYTPGSGEIGIIDDADGIGYCYTSIDPPTKTYGSYEGYDNMNTCDTDENPTAQSDYGLISETFDNLGDDPNVTWGPNYGADTTFLFTNSIDLTIVEGQIPTLRITIQDSGTLEIMDGDETSSTVVSPPMGITVNETPSATVTSL